ncbi:MAG TPA: hypothetical protein VMU42_11595 [Candidatus Sulfotelmatobacter sp.]|nr:hypothetical protein [Candidatus Sulfotelmatobacter sp.]
MMVAFELQTYQGGAWKIDSMFDDRDLAVMEAQRLGKSDRYSAVRLIEEVYNPETQNTTTRTIFRTSRLQGENEAAIERKKQVNAEVRAEGAKMKTATNHRKQVERKQQQVKQTTNWLAGMVLKGGGILLIGIGILYALHLVAEKI